MNNIDINYWQFLPTLPYVAYVLWLLGTNLFNTFIDPLFKTQIYRTSNQHQWIIAGIGAVPFILIVTYEWIYGSLEIGTLLPEFISNNLMLLNITGLLFAAMLAISKAVNVLVNWEPKSNRYIITSTGDVIRALDASSNFLRQKEFDVEFDRMERERQDAEESDFKIRLASDEAEGIYT